MSRAKAISAHKERPLQSTSQKVGEHKNTFSLPKGVKNIKLVYTWVFTCSRVCEPWRARLFRPRLFQGKNVTTIRKFINGHYVVTLLIEYLYYVAYEILWIWIRARPGSNQDQRMRRFKKGHNSDTFTLKRPNLPHHPVAIPARPACPAAAARFLVAVTHSERRRLPFRSPRWVWADFRTERQRVTWHSEMGKLYLLCFV